MTFSLTARDPQTGAFGMVVSSSSPAVASRCIHLRPGVGVVASQNVTNPVLGTAILDSLAAGKNSAAALEAALGEEKHPAYRQISVVDSSGSTAHHSGANSLGTTHWILGEAAVAAGNLLAFEETVEELLSGYAESSAETFEGRLLDGLTAAMAAGGEAGPVRSAGIKIVENLPWAVTDLRVDDADEPIAELQRLWELWAPQKADYRTRALNPEEAPNYGVPGDL
ncbi:DUF1028 domain-containing protein [Nesterenkonia ebinurensis]|uniref:DUF1028 domain-containing protein n=1 Tax=Nesterenkonia ebinurensis TaxID=2608252 RepID=UPI00123DF228|nr:DUF1028 domain-containing protein [Nesterenkonia ebinurensis]